LEETSYSQQQQQQQQHEQQNFMDKTLVKPKVVVLWDIIYLFIFSSTFTQMCFYFLIYF